MTGSPEPTAALEIEIAPLEGDAPTVSSRHLWHDGGVDCTIGTNNLIELPLPRQHYPTIGQRVLRILWRKDGIRAEAVVGPVAPVLLDGEQLRDEPRPIAEGSHELQLGAGHRFRITLRATTAIQEPAREAIAAPSGSPYKDEDESCDRADAKLVIYPRTLDPRVITERLGIAPTRVSVRGVEETTPSGVRRPAPNSLWVLSTEGRIRSRELRRHLDWLIERLRPRCEALREVQADSDVRLICVFWSNTAQVAPRLSPPQMAALAELGLEVTFDVTFYPPDEDPE